MSSFYMFQDKLPAVTDPASPVYDRIQQILGFLEAAEVLLELAGTLAGGGVGKWAVIVVVQLIK